MHHEHAGFDWTDAAIGRLRTLWAEGHSTAEIGRRLGITKNSVVGKSHRLDLPARPSPIRQDGPRQPPRPRRLRGPTLPSLQSLPAPAPTHEEATRAAPAPAPAAPRAPDTMATLQPPSGRQPCCWPIGEPGTASFRFCSEPNLAGKPYCPDHSLLAYRKKRDRREDAA